MIHSDAKPLYVHGQCGCLTLNDDEEILQVSIDWVSLATVVGKQYCQAAQIDRNSLLKARVYISIPY